MHLRRALLLFAIVLGLAAIAASVSRPQNEPAERSDSAGEAPATTQEEQTPTVAPGNHSPPGEVAEVGFEAAETQTRRVSLGASATIVVEVDEPGQVEIASLGVSASADELTPARFEIFALQAGRHEISFAPADGDEARAAGTLVVEPAEG